MEIAKQIIVDDEPVHLITTLGASPELIETMRREARRAKVQEYVRRFEEAQQSLGLGVDTEL